MKSLRFQPIVGQTEKIIETILRTEEVSTCTEEMYAIHLVCEEIVVNIVNYAYPDNNGYLIVELMNDGKILSIVFRDGGIPFNPLEKGVPDISLPLEEREIGGLGIFLTQQMMDVVSYDYLNNENVLTINKCISHEKQDRNPV